MDETVKLLQTKATSAFIIKGLNKLDVPRPSKDILLLISTLYKVNIFNIAVILDCLNVVILKIIVDSPALIVPVVTIDGPSP